MPKKTPKDYADNRLTIYVKPMDKQLFKWAKKQRQSLSEVIALALQEYREKHSK
jgi:hypothetical protein